MNQNIANLILFFITTLLISVFYWRIAHVVLVRHIRYRLFARRDVLRRMAIDGREDKKSFSYQECESFICKTISVLPSISLASFIWFSFRNSNEPCPESERLRKEASPELCKLLDKTVKDALIIMFLNSPLLFSFGAVASLLLWLAGRFNGMRVYEHAECFVDELPCNACSLQPA